MWSSQWEINLLEGVQKFCTKSLLQTIFHFTGHLTKLPILKQRRIFLKTVHFFYIKFMSIFTFTYSLMHRPSLNLQSHHNINVMFTPVHAHTNAYKYSFFPHCISLWNHLSHDIFDGDHSITSLSFRTADLHLL